MSFEPQAIADLVNVSKIFIEDTISGQILLTIYTVSLSTNGKQIIYYTNNPIIINIIKIPIVNKGRFLVGSSASTDADSIITIPKGNMNQLLPKLPMSNDFGLQY